MFLHIPAYSYIFHSYHRHTMRTPREICFMLYSMIFHSIPRHSRDPCGCRGSRFSYGITRYSIIVQGIPETLAGTEESLFILYSMIFHDIPRSSRDPCGCQGSCFLFGIPQYSIIFQGIPETHVGTEGVDFYAVFPRYSIVFQGIPRYSIRLQVPRASFFHMVFHDIPVYSKACQRPLRVPGELMLI